MGYLLEHSLEHSLKHSLSYCSIICYGVFIGTFIGTFIESLFSYLLWGIHYVLIQQGNLLTAVDNTCAKVNQQVANTKSLQKHYKNTTPTVSIMEKTKMKKTKCSLIQYENHGLPSLFAAQPNSSSLHQRSLHLFICYIFIMFAVLLVLTRGNNSNTV